MIALGKTLFKLAKKYNIVLLRCFKVSLQLLSLLIFFFSEVITITCYLYFQTHTYTLLFLPFFYLFFFFSVSQSKVFYIHSSVTCSFHLICFGNLSILVPIILLHSFWHLLNIHIQGHANTYSVSSLLLDM